MELQIGEGARDRRRGAVKPPDRGQRASIGAVERGATPNRRSLRVSRGGKGEKSSPQVQRATVQRTTLHEVNTGEGKGRIATVVADRRREEDSRGGRSAREQ